MALDWIYIALALASAVGITVVLRAAPFAIKDAIKDSPLLANLNAWMPLGVTVILVVYCLSAIKLGDLHQSIPQIAGVVATVAAHLWRRSIFLSITCGTMTCVVLANWVVPLWA